MENVLRAHDPKQILLFPRSLGEYAEEGAVSIFVRDLLIEQVLYVFHMSLRILANSLPPKDYGDMAS